MYTSKNIAISLLALLDEGHEEKKVLHDFIQFVERHKLESQLPEIVRHMEKINAEEKNFNQVSVETAHPTNKDILHKIRDHIKAPHDTVVENTVNENVIGGFIARYQGVEYDTSLKTKLRKLKEHLLAV